MNYKIKPDITNARRLTISWDAGDVAGKLTIGMDDLVQELTDTHRLILLTLLCESINDPGTIDKMREEVNSPGYND